jgi:hypothetical protein
VNFDMCLFKKVPIRKVSEGFSVQFRAEVFNIFNHTNFAAPTTTSSTLFTPTGGAIPTAGLLSGLVNAIATESSRNENNMVATSRARRRSSLSQNMTKRFGQALSPLNYAFALCVATLCAL